MKPKGREDMSKGFQYGGQAVIEGVMMRGPKNLAIAVRKPNQEIVIEKKEVSSITDRFPILKKPGFRGIVALIESMIMGVQALNFSANQSMDDEEEELTTKELAFTVIFAFGLAIGLFAILPTVLTKFVDHLVTNVLAQNLVEGVIRIAIFTVYIVAISRMRDIQRVFQYHGAEHKVIHAMEAGEELTVANCQRYTTLHPRCGTSFLLIVMLTSIFIFAFLGKQELLWRISSRVLLMPLVAGLSYEIIKLAGKHQDNMIMRAISAPGLMLQKLTTREPEDQQVEVAITALQHVVDDPVVVQVTVCSMEDKKEVIG